MTCQPGRRIDAIARFFSARCPHRRSVPIGAVAGLLYALTASPVATAQEAVISTTAAPSGSGTASQLNLATVKPRSATDGSLALPSLSVIDDGSGPRPTSLVLQLPDADLGETSLASSLGDQRLPAVFRAGALAGPALASPERGLTLTTTGSTSLNLAFGQMRVPAAGR